ncbi:GPO family capsid scaffolding protein [Sphingomonas sp. ABOLF]|uniref:GPO family capsid scaffolding protein n=1 Tax=Sphingomonas sp. ABOLF TaxID=1985879 RepID=UPI0013DEB342|nr:GPO family capsid scaffolding protein [Sphingomonas sp. ABOLF]
MAKSKFFRIAVEGATATDGRKVERQWLQDAVGNFNRDTFGVRLNCEHLRGLSPDGPFGAYGDVLEVKAEEADIQIDGKMEKRLALFASLDPTDELVAINKRRQKIYTSCEFAPNFGGTGKFGLVGVAITDNPASLGTEALQFSALKPMFDARKLSPENLFTAVEEGTLELEPETAGTTADPSGGAFASMKNFFDKLTGNTSLTPVAPAPTTPPAPPAPAQTAPANDNFSAEMRQGMGLISAALVELNGKVGEVATLRTEVSTLKSQIANTEAPQQFTRQPATGGGAQIQTDF